ncbi:MAG: hypothetical protein PHI79_08455 [Sulfurovaceae bacterium]|nr:hypothetical protein [Sulfurovaceae bacterium]
MGSVKNGGKKNVSLDQVENEEELQDVDQNFEELSDTKKLNLSLSYIDRFQDFIRKSELLEATAVYYLYKYDSLTSQSKSFISKFTDVEPPDEDAIGRRFGSGKYLIVVAISPCSKAPEGAMRAYNIKIHSYYDTLKVSEPINQPIPNTTIINTPQNNFKETVSMIAQLVSIITPLLQQRNDNTPDFNQILFKSYETTNDVLKRNLMENIKVSGELQRKLLENGGNSEMETEHEETSLIDQFKPLLIEWLPKLIGDNPQSKAVQALVQNLPQFKEVTKNTDELRILINYLDNEKGKSTTDKILQNLKLKRV